MLVKLKCSFAISFFIFGLFVTFSACNHTKSELEKLNWLQGRWENETAGIKTIEVWQQENAGAYKVLGFMLEGSDTIFSETILVAPIHGNIFYSVTIPDQNKGKAILFKLTENTGSKAVFENPEHDFPQQIAYQKAGSDSVIVQLSGKIKTQVKEQLYYLRKSKN